MDLLKYQTHHGLISLNLDLIGQNPIAIEDRLARHLHLHPFGDAINGDRAIAGVGEACARKQGNGYQ